MTCAEWVKKSREKLNLTQDELAEQSGVSKQMIDAIENGRRPVHLGTKRKLEKVLLTSALGHPNSNAPA